MKRLFLIDGHALIFRSYYAFIKRPMINSKGVDTSVLFGFTKTLLELIIKEKPTHLGVAFDPPAKTFRHELFQAYKANRGETPELIKEALLPLKEILESISVPVLMKDGFEADDVIGTIAKKAGKEGFTVYMVTPDKDYGQLVSENVLQYKPGKNGGERDIIGPEEIAKIYGVKDPASVADILAIWGDASDNIPGVRGIGEVGSKKLIQKYGSVENIYRNLDELPEKIRNSFTEGQEQIALSRKLVKIDTDVAIEYDTDDLKLETPHFERIKELFNKYEFSSLIRTLPSLRELFSVPDQQGTSVTTLGQKDKSREDPAAYRISDKKSLLAEIKSKNEVAIVRRENFLILSVSNLVHKCPPEELSFFREILESEEILKAGTDLKSTIQAAFTAGIEVRGYLADSELMHYILMPERAHKTDILASSYLGVNLQGENAPVQKDLFDSLPESPAEEEQLPFREAVIMIPLCRALQAELEASGQRELYDTLEMPLIYILASMENTGVKIDVALLAEYQAKLSQELSEIERRIRDIATDPGLNISSPKQIGDLLYDRLGLLPKGKGSSGKRLSTDEETLSEISHLHPVIPLILEFRNIKKLLSTYLEPLPGMISPVTGKIHTTYNQALTATGRLSSVKPNLQNIPIRTERGKEIRRAFIPSDPQGVILSADYSQIELRLMAHMSGDKDFIEAFRDGKDIHAATAAKIFGVPEENVSREQRNRAKVANFGIIYGISAFGLSQRLKITREESKKLISDYFSSYPGVKDYITRMIGFAREKGYVSTLYGRKRFLPGISSKNQTVRGMAERNAVNAPIQGSAADIIKAAMIAVQGRVVKDGLKSKMVLQVHDELLFDVVPGESETLSRVVKEEMENIIKLSVPLIVECNSGINWLEAH